MAQVATVSLFDGTAYGKSCETYGHKAQAKLKNMSSLILSGHGCSLSVKHDALVVRDGLSYKAQADTTSVLYRGVHGIKSIVVLSDSGNVTLDGLWDTERPPPHPASGKFRHVWTELQRQEVAQQQAQVSSLVFKDYNTPEKVPYQEEWA